MELIKIENNDIVISKDFIKEYREFQKIKLAMELKEKEFKEELKEAMELTGRTDKPILLEGFCATYRKGSVRQTVDTKALRKDYPGIVEPYIRETETSASVIIKCE